MVYNQIGANSNIVNFVEQALKKSGISYNEAVIKDVDFDRVYLFIDNEAYDIRTWNINSKGISYSINKLFAEYGEELCHSFISKDAIIA